LAFLLILFYLFLGLGLQRISGFSERFLTWILKAVIWICLPALALLKLPTLAIKWSSLLPVFTVWMSFGFAWLWAKFWQKKFKWNPQSLTCLALTMGLGNTSFLGFPLLISLIGSEALPPAIVMDLAGSFLILGTLGIFLLSKAKGQSRSGWELFKQLFQFPPFLAFLTGGAMLFMGVQLTGVLAALAEGISALLSPLALVAVGLQLKQEKGRELKPLLWTGLSYKLLLAPSLSWITCLAFGVEPALLKIIVLENAMGPMITSALMAAEAELNPALASQMVGVGIPLCLLSVPLWWMLLGALGY